MLSQCVNFGINSETFFDHWTVEIPLTQDGVKERPNPATVSHCDWQEVRDMMDWQAFVATIEVKDRQPDVLEKQIPLSVILFAQHNLVNYGAPFPSDRSDRTLYAPTQAIPTLAGRLDEIYGSGGEHTTGLVQLPRMDATVAKLPGMDAWVQERLS